MEEKAWGGDVGDGVGDDGRFHSESERSRHIQLLGGKRNTCLFGFNLRVHSLGEGFS